MTIDVRTDAELAVDAAAGSASAFEELYRRHSPAAWRVAYAVTGNRDDAADAVSDAFTRVLQALPAGRLSDANLVRSYLLTATRNAAIDVSRRGGRVRSTDRLDHLDDGTKVSSPTERLADQEDVSIVARAFRSLPERWRSVLWLTEVEGIPPKEAAALLGVTPNNMAQLAVRARAGLRERFVQAHLTGAVADECKFTVERLGAYVTGRLAPRDLAKVDQHLAACRDCDERRDQLEDVGGVLRRVVVPLPLLLGPAALAKWKLAFSVGAAADVAGTAANGASTIGSGAAKAGRLVELSARLQKPLLAASTGIFAVGVIVAAPNVLGAPRDNRPSFGQRAPLPESSPALESTPAVVPSSTVRMVTASPASFSSLIDDATAALPPTQDAAGAADGASTADGPGGPAAPAPSPREPGHGGGTPPPPPPPPSDPTPPEEETALVELGAAVVAGPITGGIVLGDECQGGYLMSGAAGTCEAPEAESETLGITVVTGGTTPIAGRKYTLGF